MLKANTVVFLVALSVLAGVHYIALELFLYWRYLWLDMPVHLVGGSVVSLSLFVAAELKLPFVGKWKNNFLMVMTFVVTIMISWELFEIWAGVHAFEPQYKADTIVDLIMGFLGGMIGFFVGKRLETLE